MFGQSAYWFQQFAPSLIGGMGSLRAVERAGEGHPAGRMRTLRGSRFEQRGQSEYRFQHRAPILTSRPGTSIAFDTYPTPRPTDRSRPIAAGFGAHVDHRQQPPTTRAYDTCGALALGAYRRGRRPDLSLT